MIQPKILITSGGTQEYIDDVRVMTNISSGKLGKIIAEEFAERLRIHDFRHRKASIDFVYGKNTEYSERFNIKNWPIKSAQEAMNKMAEIVPHVNAVIHCMAVSDFTFKRDSAIKCKSSDPEAFIEYMRRTIMPNPKIISRIKQWNPSVILVGFKFEVGVNHDILESLAQNSIDKNGCDLVVANDKIEMKTFDQHIGHFFFSEPMKKLGYKTSTQGGKLSISKEICDFVLQVLEAK